MSNPVLVTASQRSQANIQNFRPKNWQSLDLNSGCVMDSVISPLGPPSGLPLEVLLEDISQLSVLLGIALIEESHLVYGDSPSQDSFYPKLVYLGIYRSVLLTSTWNNSELLSQLQISLWSHSVPLPQFTLKEHRSNLSWPTGREGKSLAWFADGWTQK